MKHRAILIFGVFATMAGPTFAGPREDTLSGISRCSAIPDDRTFLDCVYGAAQPLRARLGLPPAPPFQTQLVPRAVPAVVPPVPAGAPIAAAPATSRAEKNGLLGGLFGSDDGHALTMVSYTFDSHGMFTVTLNNGEVWRQRQNDTNYADLRGPASHYVVSVVDNGSGDAKMDVKGEGGPYAVQRVR
jgi:hypothetical protein